MSAIVYWSRRDGLANRLRAVAGYKATSMSLGVPFYLCWEPDPACDATFRSLFGDAGIDVVSRKEADSLERGGARILEANHSIARIWKTCCVENASWHEFGGLAVRVLRSLVPREEIMAVVDEFSDRHSMATVSSAHVRFTDNVSTLDEWARKYPHFDRDRFSTLKGVYTFIEDMMSTHPDNKIFLATDNTDVEEKLKRDFADLIITYPKAYRRASRWSLSLRKIRVSRNLQRTSSIVDALIEMMILSRSRIIAGTYWSSFSSISALYGDGEFVVIEGDRYVDDPAITELKALYAESVQDVRASKSVS